MKKSDPSNLRLKLELNLIILFVVAVLFNTLIVTPVTSNAATTTPKILFKPNGIKFGGENVTVIGTGFTPLRTVTITFTNISLVIQKVTNLNGRFSKSFIMPALVDGHYGGVATDGILSVHTSFVILPKLYLNETSVARGHSFVLSGNGFFGSSMQSFRTGTGYFNPGLVSVNSTGGFIITLPVPLTSSTGAYIIQAAKPLGAKINITIT